MTFLTGWRLALAADLLRDPSLTLADGRPPGGLLHAVRAVAPRSSGRAA